MCNCCAGRNRPERAVSAARPETARRGNVTLACTGRSPQEPSYSIVRHRKRSHASGWETRSWRSWCPGRETSDCSRPAIIRGRSAVGSDHRFQVRVEAPFGDSRNAGSRKHGHLLPGNTPSLQPEQRLKFGRHFRHDLRWSLGRKSGAAGGPVGAFHMTRTVAPIKTLLARPR